MDVVFGIVRHIVVDDHQDVVDVNAARHDVGGHEHIHLSGLEAVHHVVALLLAEVAVHRGAVDVQAFEFARDVLHLVFLAREDDDALQLAGLEEVADDVDFLRLVAHVGGLLDFLGRLGHGNLHLHGIGEQRASQLLDFLRHGGREHDGLVAFGQQLGNLQDVVRETHVEHTVGLVEDEEREVREVQMSHADVGQQSSRRGNDHVGSHLQSLRLLVEARAIVAAIDGHARHIVEIIAEALHGLVYLLRQFAGGRHHDAVDRIARIAAVVKQTQHGQQIGRRLSGAGLCYADEVAAVENLWNTLFLDGSHLLKAHIIECVEDVVVEVCFFECHGCFCFIIQ